jgi:serine-type D-Ala-D-Ala carboxypeptidase (penicillin-binding protein 5/6)
MAHGCPWLPDSVSQTQSMRSWRRLVLAAALCASALPLADGTGFGAVASAQQAPAPTDRMPADAPDVAAEAFAVIDVPTGKVLAAKDLHTPRLAASTTKTMTVLTALRLGTVDRTATVSLVAASKPESKIGLPVGTTWAMGDLVYATMLKSANDAAYVIAEGSVDAPAADLAADITAELRLFAVEMNETARLIGMRESTFNDPAGLDAATDAPIGPTTMSPFDLGVLGRAALSDPTLRQVVGTLRYDIASAAGTATQISNHNEVLRPTSPTYIEGSFGVKTGATAQAGRTYIAVAQRNGRTLMVTLMGARDIFTSARVLFNWAFATTTDASPGIGETLPDIVDVSAGVAMVSTGVPVESVPAPQPFLMSMLVPPAQPPESTTPADDQPEEAAQSDPPVQSDTATAPITDAVVPPPSTSTKTNDDHNAVLVAGGTLGGILIALTAGRRRSSSRVSARTGNRNRVPRSVETRNGSRRAPRRSSSSRVNEPSAQSRRTRTTAQSHKPRPPAPSRNRS